MHMIRDNGDESALYITSCALYWRSFSVWKYALNKKMSEYRLRINSATVKQVQGNKSHLKWVILSTQIFACQRGYICNVFFYIYIFGERGILLYPVQCFCCTRQQKPTTLAYTKGCGFSLCSCSDGSQPWKCSCFCAAPTCLLVCKGNMFII